VRRRRALLWVGAATGSVAVVGATLIFAFWDRATPVDARDVAGSLDRAIVGEHPGEYGLYVYETTGHETTDALGGGRHDYPAETYLTIVPGGCGTLVRWQALAERWTEWEICDDGTLAGWESYHEWFGVGNLDDWTCPAPPPVIGEPGESWPAICAEEGRTQSMRFDVVGLETLVVGGEEVETLHVRQTDASTGDTDGEGTADVWILPGTLLVVQRVAGSVSVTESRIGPVRYAEEYRLKLTSMTPRHPDDD
jgi:hypothetical protein